VKPRQRIELKQDRALAVLRLLPCEPPGASVGRLADLAFGLDSERNRRHVRAAVGRIIYELHCRVHRRKGVGGSMQYWVDPRDRAAREAVIEDSGFRVQCSGGECA